MKTSYLIILFWFAFFTNVAMGQKVSPKGNAPKNNSAINVRTNISNFNCKVKIFPEEITSYLYLHVAGHSSAMANFKIKDAQGRIFINEPISLGQTEKFSVNNFPRGTYTVVISLYGIVIKTELVTLI